MPWEWLMLWLWIAFVVFVLTLLALDLGVLSRKSETVSVKRAMIFTSITVILALGFAGAVYWMYDTNFQNISTLHPEKGGENNELLPKTGLQATAKFLNAWVIEYALSMDNILVIALIFRYFKIPQKFQHRVLFWGIMGALIMRGVMIGAGTLLVQQFSWILYVFGAVLIYTAVKVLISDEESIDPEKTIAARLARKLFPLTPDLDGNNFFTRKNGTLFATPLFLVLLVIEGTDVIFAIDSIPAAFAITSDPFLVFTSNIFAILGLRSMYFALAAVIDRFHYLKIALVFVLAFIGVKMLISKYVHIEPHISLAIVLGLLATGVLASLLAPSKHKPEGQVPPPGDGAQPLSGAGELPEPPSQDQTAQRGGNPIDAHHG
jgi:tellurite resistance protein TerC